MLVMRVKLSPTPAQAIALTATLAACNEAADRVAEIAFRTGQMSRSALQKACYLDLKSRGLSAQPALHVLRKAADAYTVLRANIRAGNLTGKRKAKAESKPISFRPDAAQPFDDRCLSWQHDARTVSIWTTEGRLKGVAFTGHPGQLTTVREHRRGESDLVCDNGTWFLLATCEIPEREQFEPVDWIGVDRGIVNLATTSDG